MSDRAKQYCAFAAFLLCIAGLIAIGVTAAKHAEPVSGYQGPIGPRGERGLPGANGTDGKPGQDCDCAELRAEAVEYVTTQEKRIAELTTRINRLEADKCKCKCR